eukprot:Lithocolla_globosa_v1_NODE_1559_length_2492_cov_7.594984.p1 type:complete len:265 gc:universal NODE_1559_length_2492_cov_7.594984:1488-694(-)
MVSTKINNINVKPIEVQKTPLKNVKGVELFESLYCNIFLCAKKKSGKTSVIFNILKHCVDKNSKVIVFCATYLKDDNWIDIEEYLNKKKIPNEFYSSIHEGLDNTIEEMKNYEDEEEISEDEPPPRVISFSNDKICVKKRKIKPKYITPRYVLIFDDLSTELRDKRIGELLKIHRHLKSKIILSSQWLNDLLPMSRRQIDYFLIFQGMCEAKLLELYKQADLSISFEKFKSLYKEATHEKYNFFYVDVNDENNFRKNFNQRIEV